MLAFVTNKPLKLLVIIITFLKNNVSGKKIVSETEVSARIDTVAFRN
jgi:hypothetical protein